MAKEPWIEFHLKSVHTDRFAEVTVYDDYTISWEDDALGLVVSLPELLGKINDAMGKMKMQVVI